MEKSIFYYLELENKVFIMFYMVILNKLIGFFKIYCFNFGLGGREYNFGLIKIYMSFLIICCLVYSYYIFLIFFKNNWGNMIKILLVYKIFLWELNIGIYKV